MRNLSIKLSHFAVLALSMIFLVVSSCSKDDDQDPSGCKFVKSDFAVESVGGVAGNLEYIAEFDVKNLKDMDYDSLDPEHCYHRIEVTMEATDGSVYKGQGSIPNMSPKGSGAVSVYINHPRGKVMKPSTIKFEMKSGR